MKSVLSKILIIGALLCAFSAKADSICAPAWRIGLELQPASVPGTNGYLTRNNVNTTLAADIRADFTLNPSTFAGRCYRGLYQGVGLGMTGFFTPGYLGNPGSAYVYQGAPIVHFGKAWSLEYEWQFGTAFGWKHYSADENHENVAVSTPATALMGLGFKFVWRPAARWQLSAGIAGRHFSNGNTSWPNRGVNALGASLGVAYVIDTHHEEEKPDIELPKFRPWFFDIIAYGAWRKRAITIGDTGQMIPGRFGILGLQGAAMRRLDPWVAVGVAVDTQWDESADIANYWVEGTMGEEVKFYRPPIGRQISLGLSAHAELTTPIFSVNTGLGYDFLNPQGDKRFFQSLAVKAFVLPNLFVNVGYRIGGFRVPQNLMLGVGYRF